MDLISIILIAIALSMDAFAVALTSGIIVKKPPIGSIVKLAFFFGFFQFLMPVIGFALGRSVYQYIEAADHWVAFGLLAFIGGRMILESRKKDDERHVADPFSTKTLFVMAIATSIDALAVGVGFAMTLGSILSPALLIGAITFCLSILGVYLGKTVGGLFQQRAEQAGGIILVLIGLKILVEHLIG